MWCNDLSRYKFDDAESGHTGAKIAQRQIWPV